MVTHYMRQDLPDGFAEFVTRLAERLNEGATDLEAAGHSRDQADRYNGCIDAKRLMRRTATDLVAMTQRSKLPG